MESNSYVVIQQWMCSELNLKGTDLLVFALIHGFSQDGESRFTGSRKYIAETFNISLPTVDRAIKNLLDKELIEQHKSEKNGIVFNSYNSLYPIKKFYRGSKETLHNNIEDNIGIIKKTNSKELVQEFEFGGRQKPKKDSLYTKCLSIIDNFIETYPNKEELRSLLIQYLNLRLEMKDRPIYTNQWKGLLNKLLKLTIDTGTDIEDIIRYSIERGYASFYAPPKYNKNGKSVENLQEQHIDSYTKEELTEIQKLNAERERNGLRTKF